MKKTLTVFTVLLLVSSLLVMVAACDEPDPAITLSPPQGFAMTMITGTGFDESKTITIAYDGAVQSTIPLKVKTDSKGCFTALISIPDELAVGAHAITATDAHGNSASSTFTVVDMTGPQGIQGAAGQNGKDGIDGTNGIDGINGKDGVNGANGLNGQDFNATGNVLVYNGTDGLNGEDGINGVNGINGANGINGKDGTNGAQGLPGTQGQQGTTGQVVVYSKPATISGADLQSFIIILVIALIAFTGAMITVYRKSNS